ncbi:MAG: FkbM family methyltransferase [Collimonas pratensis]|uniref:FkbM family methyltransferase n=1 Tax=Collimonas pratensis TaxID=279113 RepID=UPI003C78FA3C
MTKLKLPKEGYYVDIGCGWPEMNSNTAFLRKRGWSGLCVDANPRYAPEWKGIEKFICTVIGSGEKMPFTYSGIPELSHLGEGQLVQTVTLESLLEDVPKIDLISCDAEGSEFDILSQLDWQKYRPKVVIAEYSTHNVGEDFRVRDMLLPMGYQAAHQTKANIIYVWP